MKKILYVILGLVVIYLVLCLIGPAHVKIQRSIEINASADVVKAKIPDMKFFHEQWSPWTEKDPGMKVTYQGETGAEGSSMAWVSNHKEVGKGSMTYRYTRGDTVMMTLHFDDYGDSKVYHIVAPKGEKCTVTWTMESETPFLGRAVMLFMNMDKMVGPDFEKGLNKLKTAIESNPSGYDIHEMTWEAKTYYGERTMLAYDKISAFMGATYGKIGSALGAKKIEPMGAPKAIYFSFDESTMMADFAPVMEVSNGTYIKGLTKFETPAGKVLHLAYYGPYDGSIAAHHAMDDYTKKHNLTTVTVMEEYVTDPMTEKDASKWLTNIYYFVK